MRHALFKYLIVVFALFNAAIGTAQTYNFTSLSVENGLAQNQVLSIFQDDKGNLWFGTNNLGVSVFDGSAFKTIDASDGLINNIVYAITQDENGNVYLGTNGGVSVYNGKTFANYGKEKGLPHTRVFSLHYSKSRKRLFIGTSEGLCYLEGDTILKTTFDSTLAKTGVFSMFEDSKNNLWIGTTSLGAVKIENDKSTYYSGVSHPFVRAFVEDGEGNIWVGTYKLLNMIDKEGNIIEKRIEENQSQLTVTTAFRSSDGELWFGTEVGIYRYKNGRFTRYKEDNGLVGNAIWCSLQDREGNYWFGTTGKGVVKFNYKGDAFFNYSKKDGLSSDMVYSIFEDSKGRFWIGSEDGLTIKDSTSFTIKRYVDEQKNPLGLAVKAFWITEDRDHNIWVATRAKGLYKFTGEKYENYSTAQGLIDPLAYCVVEDKDGSLWIGTKKGVCVFKDGKFTTLEAFNKEVNVWFIHIDDKGDKWFATDNGVVHFDGSSVQYYDSKDGFVDGRVRGIVQDKSNNLWFSTDEGIFLFESGKFRQFNQQSGLSSNIIYAMLFDDNGFLWLGSNMGLDKIDLKKLKNNLPEAVRYFGKVEGFMGVECNANAAFKDSQGRLWFGTVNGVTVFDPKLEHKNPYEPATRITNLRYQYNDSIDFWTPYSSGFSLKTGLPENLVLPYNINHLTFDFIGISHANPGKVKYQYQLYPLDVNWRPATSKNEAVYSHVPPGEYVFRVRAMNNDGVWNEHPVEFSFTVLSPWYLRWWAFLTYFVIIAAVTYFTIVVRTKALEKQKRVLEHQVKARTAELVKEKEKVEQINFEVTEKNHIIEHKNREITDSINYAKGIQDAILPSDDKVRANLNEAFILFRPKDIVSGDFYWLEPKDGKVFFGVADCTGHGVPGAFVSLVGSNGLNRSINGFKLRDTGKILDQLTLLVEETFIKRKDGMDIALCAIEENRKSFQYSGANNPLWLVRKKGNPLSVNNVLIEANIDNEEFELFEIKADKQPVGNFENRKPFTTNEVAVLPGDMIYMFSDGYADQFGGPKGKKFMTKSMKKMMLDICHEPVQKQKVLINESIENWMVEGQTEQVDDICMMGVRI